MNYVIKTQRLGLRNWIESDLLPMSKLNQDDAVMKYFPSKYSKQQTGDFVRRMQDHYEQHGFCYFAVDRIEEAVDRAEEVDPQSASRGNETQALELSLPDPPKVSRFVGFIGLMNQTYESHFTPCVDIGWRLDRSFWGQGYATEGAAACLRFAFERLGLSEIMSVASQTNRASERVMQKIGMTKVDTFNHPLLAEFPELNLCNLYQANS